MENLKTIVRSNALERIVLAQWPEIRAHGEKIVVSLSGGSDSMAVLGALVWLRRKHHFALSAVHFNHHWMPQAAEWETFCAQTCAHLDVTFQVQHLNLTEHKKLGFEATARRARYAFFEGSRAWDWVVMGHHQDDQLESFLLQLFRGAGTWGLSVMKGMRPLGADGPQIWRPYLGLTKQALQSYCQLIGLTWVEDASNSDVRYQRNFLRQEVLPRLDQGSPRWRKAVVHAIDNLSEAQEILDEVARQDTLTCAVEAGLAEDRLRQLSLSRGHNLIRWWLRHQGVKVPARAHIEEWWKQCHSPPDRHPCIRWSGGKLHRHRGVWYFSPLDS